MSRSRPNPIRPGERFGDLAVQEVIGRGAFSTVYLAEDTLLHRQVAMKVVDTSRIADKEKAREDILREARLVARLASPHVITLHRVHELPDDLWAFEMEYLAGGSLLQRLEQEGAMPTGEARRILRAVLHALEVAHARDVIHHDIKPANVLLGDDGSVKLTDFGLGRLITEEGLTAREERHARGTPYYMSPEVVMGLDATPASDLWSVGVLLYRMLSGRLPFPAKSLASLFLEIQNALPAPLGERTSPHLASIALRCLAKAPQDRPAAARDLLREMGSTTETTPIPVSRPAAPPGSSALFGREKELELFRGWTDGASRGEGRTVLLLGEPGIGKSALAAEIGQEIRARDYRWVEVRLSQLEGLRRPLLDSVQRCLEREAESSSSSGSTGTRRARASDEILDKLRAAEDSDTRQEILGSTWQLERILTTLSKEKPLCVLVEDVHVCEHDEIRTLAGLSTALADKRLMLILTWRTKDPEQSDGSEGPPSGYYDLIALPHLRRLELDPLSDVAIRRLLEEAAGTRAVALEIQERIIRESEGVPLYALALYRHLLAAEEIEKTEDQLRPTRAWGQTPPPRFIREMVTRRLERLTPEESLLLETASVSGSAFDGNLLANLVGAPLLQTLRSLQRLYRERALVEPLERGYRFAHGLFRDAIYADLAPDLKRALHRAYAEGLEGGAASKTADPEVLGWHWEQAGEAERAQEPLRQATHLAVRGGELDRAWDLASRAGVFADDLPPEKLRDNMNVLLSLGTRLGSAESVQSLQDLHARLLSAAEVLGDNEMRLRTQVGVQWDHFIREGVTGVDTSVLEEAVADMVHPVARFEAFWLLGNLEKQQGRYDEARALYDRADEALESAPRQDQHASLNHSRALMTRSEGRLEDALATFDKSAASWDLEGSPVHAAISRSMAQITRLELGQLEGCAEGMDAPIRALERGRQRARAALARLYKARMLLAEGRVQDATDVIERAEPILTAGRYGSGLFQILAFRLRLQLLRGELGPASETLRAVHEALGPEQAAEDPTTLVRGALLHLLQGDHEEARRLALLTLEDHPGRAAWLSLGDCVVALAELVMLGLDLPDVDDRVDELIAGAQVPPFLSLSRDVLEAALHPDEPKALLAGAVAAADPRVGHRQAEVAVYGMIFRARVLIANDEREEAATLLAQARERARELAHVWLELVTLKIAREAGLPRDEAAERSVERMLRDRNLGDTERVDSLLASWLSD